MIRLHLDAELVALAEQRRQRIARKRALWDEHKRRRRYGLAARHRRRQMIMKGAIMTNPDQARRDYDDRHPVPRPVDFPCPRCGAEAGRPCRGLDGGWSHDRRRALAVAARIEWVRDRKAFVRRRTAPELTRRPTGRLAAFRRRFGGGGRGVRR